MRNYALYFVCFISCTACALRDPFNFAEKTVEPIPIVPEQKVKVEKPPEVSNEMQGWEVISKNDDGTIVIKNKQGEIRHMSINGGKKKINPSTLEKAEGLGG